MENCSERPEPNQAGSGREGRRGLGFTWTCQEPRAQPGSQSSALAVGSAGYRNCVQGPSPRRAPPQLLPAHRWEGEVLPRPQGWATLCSPRKHPLLMHPSTAASKAPFTWPLALHPLCPVRTHGPPPHFTGEGATPREGPTDPCLLPPWSPPTGLPARHPLPLSDQRRMLSPSQEQGCLLFKTSRPWGMPTGPPPRLCRR